MDRTIEDYSRSIGIKYTMVEYLGKNEGLYGCKLPVPCEVKGCGGTYTFNKDIGEYMCDKCGSLAEY